MSSTPYQTTDTLPKPGVYWVSLSYLLATLANGDILTAFTPGHNFRVIGIKAAVTAAATTAAKAATITPKIGSTAVPGVTLSLTSANMTPLGAVVEGSATTTDLLGTPTDSITLTASAVTAFVEGSAAILIGIQNIDNT